MAIPNLNDWTATLDEVCRDYLGETIQYKPAGGSFGDVTAHVDYRDMIKAFEAGQAVAQDIGLSLMKADVPAKPTRDCRVQLARLPGLTFRPINVRSDESGTHWECEVVQADG